MTRPTHHNGKPVDDNRRRFDLSPGVHGTATPPPRSPLSTLVLIDHRDAFLAAGIAALLRACPGFVVRAGGPGELAANVLVADPARGLEHMRAQAQRGREAKTACLVIAELSTAWQVRSAIAAGVSGYLLQDSSASELEQGVRCVAAGGRYLSGTVTELLASDHEQATPTTRQLQVLHLIAGGLTYKAVGGRLGIGEGTVRVHVKALSARLGESSRTAAMAEAIRRGMLPQARHWQRDSAPGDLDRPRHKELP